MLRLFARMLKNGYHLCVLSTMHSSWKAYLCFFDIVSQPAIRFNLHVADYLRVHIVVDEPHAAYNLYFFLQATGTFRYVYSIRYWRVVTLGPDFLTECINLRDVRLTFRKRDYPLLINYEKHGRTALFRLEDVPFLEDYSIRRLFDLKHLQQVRFLSLL